MSAPPLSLAAIGQTGLLHDAGDRAAAAHDGAEALAGRRLQALNAHRGIAAGPKRVFPFEDAAAPAREAAS